MHKILQQWHHCSLQWGQLGHTGSGIVPGVIGLHSLHPGEHLPPPLSFHPSCKWVLQIKSMAAGLSIFFTSSLHHPTPHVSRKGQRIVSFTFCRANNINGWQFKHKCLLKYIILCMTTAAVQREFSKMLKSLTRKRHYYRWKCQIIALHLNVLFKSVSVYCSQIK